MKKILIVLILSLTGIFQMSSQTLLNDSTCSVPCSSLRNALLMKADNKLLVSEISVTRDSVNILQKQSLVKDSLISDYKTIVSEKDTIIGLNRSIINEREKQVGDLNKNIKTIKRQRNITIIGSIATIIITLLLVK
jgi:hypothetical protein